MADVGNDSVGMADMLNGALSLPPDKTTVTGNSPDASVAIYSGLVNSTLTTENIVTNNISYISSLTIVVYYVNSNSSDVP